MRFDNIGPIYKRMHLGTNGASRKYLLQKMFQLRSRFSGYSLLYGSTCTTGGRSLALLIQLEGLYEYDVYLYILVVVTCHPPLCSMPQYCYMWWTQLAMSTNWASLSPEVFRRVQAGSTKVIKTSLRLLVWFRKIKGTALTGGLTSLEVKCPCYTDSD